MRRVRTWNLALLLGLAAGVVLAGCHSGTKPGRNPALR